MTRHRFAPLAAALVALLSACGGGGKSSQGPVAASPPTAPGSASPENAAAPSETPAPLARSTVTLYFPSASGGGLVSETREIVDTKRPEDRGAQILAALVDGPKTEGSLPAFPSGTTLRRLWVREDGNAYADFSEELMGATTGGSADEILTVYAIVDSLTANVPEIRRVGILVAGRERATFGHLDLSRPLPPDLTLAEGPKATE